MCLNGPKKDRHFFSTLGSFVKDAAFSRNFFDTLLALFENIK
jgi:hypothetical protein